MITLLKQNRSTILIGCLILGLAPFLPEPHIIGKIRWICGGAVGMQTIDWLDFFWHGTPWVLFLLSFFPTKKNLNLC
jgi:hypothetical protein